MSEPQVPGHGDHWLAALPLGDPRLMEAVAPPTDAPPGVALHRFPLTESLDLVQVTAKRRLVTAYPEPRATTLMRVRPKELSLWATRVEGWLRVEHPLAGWLTLFCTDLASRGDAYARLRAETDVEVGGLAYSIHKLVVPPGQRRLEPATRFDARFLADDYWFEAEVVEGHPAGDAFVLHLLFQNGVEIPIVARTQEAFAPGDRVQGFAWLTCRLPEGA